MSVPKVMSITKLSDLTGKDRKTISKRLELLLPVSDDGRGKQYEVKDALPLIYANDDSLRAAEQLRYEKARADKMELEVTKRRGELVEISKIAKIVEQEYAAVRAGLLAIPVKLAIPLATINDATEVKNELENAVNEVLEELSADSNYEKTEHDGEEDEGESRDSPTSESPESSEAETDS